MRPTLAAVRVKIAGFLVMTALAASAGAAGDERRISVTAGGRPVVEIALKGDAVRIAGAPGEPVLLGSLRGANKRKYRAEGGPVIAEVTLKPEATRKEPPGFKLHAPDGKLLWKVRFADWKVNISADEEGTRPWVISLKRADKLNVLDPDGQNQGSVAMRDRVVVEDAAGHQRFVVTLTGARSAALGLLLMEALPMRERSILMAEILATGY